MDHPHASSSEVRARARATLHEASGGLGWRYFFVMALLVASVWLATYPFWRSGDNTLLLVVNVTITVATFVVVFAIQASTNRTSRTILHRLDELMDHLDEDDPPKR